MELTVMLAVLLAALFHAGWNAVVKTGLDSFLAMTLVFLAAGLLSLAFVPFVGFPAPNVWPWLLASTTLHTGYKLFLVETYKAGDMGQTYPIARGTAPLLVSMAMMVFFGESIPVLSQLGILVLAAGIWVMSLRGGHREGALEKRAVLFALGTAVFIAAYTITDGMGARQSQSAHTYAIWLFLLDALFMLAILLGTRGRAGLMSLRPYWKHGLAGGVMSLCAYWLILWAMTRAPISMVAALRETSVLFAAGISVWVLGEKFTVYRIVAAVVIVSGIILVRVG